MGLSIPKKNEIWCDSLDGRFKNEFGEKCNLMMVVGETAGLKPIKWIHHMID
jgi:hypothetical protein